MRTFARIRSCLRALLPAAPLLLGGCASVHTTQGDVDTLSFSPALGLSLVGVAVVLAVPGLFFLFTPAHPGAAKGPRKGGGALLLLFGLALAVAGIWRLTWHIDLLADRIVLRTLFGHVSLPYSDIQEVKVREYQNRWRPGTLWVTIVLRRTGGDEVTLPYTTLSADDQRFLEQTLAAHSGDRMGGAGEAPVVPASGHGNPIGPPPDMAARPAVPCPILADWSIAFCTVCSHKKDFRSAKPADFVCANPKCGRRNEVRPYTPPKLEYLGTNGGKALVEKDGVTYLSGYGEEVVPGSGILNDGYDAQGETLLLARVEKVRFTDYRDPEPKEVPRDVKLQWKLEKKQK